MQAPAAPTVYATLTSPCSVAKVVSLLAELVDCVNLSFTEAGLEIITVDNARVSLVHLVLHEGAFARYQLRGRGPHTVGLRVQALLMVMRNVKGGDSVSFIQSSDDLFVVSVQREHMGSRQKNDYKIDQIMIQQDAVEIPDRDYPCEVLLPSSVVQQICKEVKPLGGEIEISVTTESIEFNVVSDTMKVNIAISPQTKDHEFSPIFAIACKEPSKQRFKTSFFSKLGKIAKVPEAKGLLISLGDGCPLSLLFQLDGLGSLNLYLAPLVEE